MAVLIQAGNAVVLPWEIRDGSAKRPPLVDPDMVTLTLARPDGTVAVDQQAMTKVSKGLYHFSYQTSISDPTGDWIQTVKTSRQGWNNIETAIAFTLAK